MSFDFYNSCRRNIPEIYPDALPWKNPQALQNLDDRALRLQAPAVDHFLGKLAALDYGDLQGETAHQLRLELIADAVATIGFFQSLSHALYEKSRVLEGVIAAHFPKCPKLKVVKRPQKS